MREQIRCSTLLESVDLVVRIGQVRSKESSNERCSVLRQSGRGVEWEGFGGAGDDIYRESVDAGCVFDRDQSNGEGGQRWVSVVDAPADTGDQR